GPELIRLQRAILDHDPTLAWRPVVAVSASGPDERFVGRAVEVARIRAAVDEVVSRRAGRGAVVVVSGEAGIGKTALAREAVGRMTGVPGVWGRGVEAAVDAPYGVWAAVSRQLARLGVIEPAPPAAGEQPLVTYAAIARSLQRAREPFAVVVDDLQWVDAATLGVLELLAGELDGLPMALVVSVRTPDVEARPAALACLTELGRARVAHRIELGGLSVADVESWLAERHGDGGRQALARVVHDRTAGHPFFIRELVALLAGDGTGAEALDRSILATVPAAVHDVVRRRVSSLPAATQQLMAAAAVLGRRVDLGVLAGVVDEPIEAVLAGLDPAMASGLLRSDPDRIGQLSFSHALVSDALRAEQTAAGLARRHAAVAVVIERRWAGDLDSVIDELAIHAHAGAAAGTAAAAVDHGARAAALATAANAPADAAAHLTRALDALAIVAPGDRARRQGLATDLGIALAAAGDAMGGRAALVEAAALADAQGDGDGVVRALRHVNGDDLWSSLDWSQYDERTTAVIRRALDRLPVDEAGSRAELTAALASELYAVDVERSLALAAEAVELAALVDDPLVQARVLLRQCWAAWRPAGQPLRAAAGDRLVEVASSGELPARFRPLAHLTRFVAAYEVGDAAVADRHVALARATADPVRTPAEWTYVLYAEWSLLVARGRFSEALELVDGVHDAMRRSRRTVAGVTRTGLWVQAFVELGRTDEALDALDGLASTPYAPSGRWWRAWTLARGGRLGEVAAELRGFDGPLADDWYRAPLLCAALHAAAIIGDADFTARHVDVLRPHEDHVAVAGSGGLVLGPVALTVARADVVLGDPVAARRSLERAEVIARRMGSAPWLEQIADVAAR
ncbi:MAG: AAA family ATPase, partial [Ilumatobacteraceae bacterium]